MLLEFNTRLIQYRKAQGISQEELAGSLNVSRQAVSKWETGEAMPDLQKAYILAEVLGVSLDQLCGKDGAQQPSAPIDHAVPKKHRLFYTVLAVVTALSLLAIGFFSGLHLTESAGADDAGLQELPDTISVSGELFSIANGKLSYRFVPSVSGEGLTYQITFTDTSAVPHSFDAVCTGGVCTGTVELSEYDSYSVNVLIGSGPTSRSVPLVWDLSFDLSGGSVSWSP